MPNAGTDVLRVALTLVADGAHGVDRAFALVAA
jgi:hypothetical protein